MRARTQLIPSIGAIAACSSASESLPPPVEPMPGDCLTVSADTEVDLELQPSTPAQIRAVARPGASEVLYGTLYVWHEVWGGWSGGAQDLSFDVLPGPHHARFCRGDSDGGYRNCGPDQSVELSGPTAEVELDYVPVDLTLELDQGPWPEPWRWWADARVTLLSEERGNHGSQSIRPLQSEAMRLSFDVVPGPYRIRLEAPCEDSTTPCGHIDLGRLDVPEAGMTRTIVVRTATLRGTLTIDGVPADGTLVPAEWPPLELAAPGNDYGVRLAVDAQGRFEGRVFAGVYNLRYSSGYADALPVGELVVREGLDASQDLDLDLQVESRPLELLARAVGTEFHYEDLLVLWDTAGNKILNLPTRYLADGAWSGRVLGEFGRVEYIPGWACDATDNLPCLPYEPTVSTGPGGRLQVEVQSHEVRFDIDLRDEIRSAMPGGSLILRNVDVSLFPYWVFPNLRLPPYAEDAGPVKTRLAPGRYVLEYSHPTSQLCLASTAYCPLVHLGEFTVDGPTTIQRRADLHRVTGHVGLTERGLRVPGTGSLEFTPRGAGYPEVVYHNVGDAGEFDVWLPTGDYSVRYSADRSGCDATEFTGGRPCASQQVRRCEP